LVLVGAAQRPPDANGEVSKFARMLEEAWALAPPSFVTSRAPQTLVAEFAHRRFDWLCAVDFVVPFFLLTVF